MNKEKVKELIRKYVPNIDSIAYNMDELFDLDEILHEMLVAHPEYSDYEYVKYFMNHYDFSEYYDDLYDADDINLIGNVTSIDKEDDHYEYDSDDYDDDEDDDDEDEDEDDYYHDDDYFNDDYYNDDEDEDDEY